jgi:formylglycine-generating enzyme
MASTSSTVRKYAFLLTASCTALVAGSGAMLFARRHHAHGAPHNQSPNSSVIVAVSHTPPSVPAGSASVSQPIAFPKKPPAWLSRPEPTTLEEQRVWVLKRLQEELNLPSEQAEKIQKIMSASNWMGQGNPKVTEHPFTRQTCMERRAKATIKPDNQKVCQASNMVPVYNPKNKEQPKDAHVCIDQYEFPNLECEYPITWVAASEAIAICEAMDKRLCDAHEWEGACAGELRSVEEEYQWEKYKPMVKNAPAEQIEFARRTMAYYHNKERKLVWAYGDKKNHKLCGMASQKSPGCTESLWHNCGTNTFPTGSFPECVSSFGVYDQHGNAAEHMNFPMLPNEQAMYGTYGHTEMKGSWFSFGVSDAHEDDCRWRAKNWHPARTKTKGNHRNYHLGFRCCKTIGEPPPLPKEN